MKRLTIGLILGMTAGSGLAATEEDLQKSFYPYRDQVPEYSGLEPGMTIDQSNVDQFKEVLDDGMYRVIKDGLTELPVAQTTPFELSQHYVEATRDNLGEVSLGENIGEINGYVAGRPFPEPPSLDDPRAGEKLAWNFRHGLNWGDNAAISPFYWRLRDLESGEIERTIKFNFHFLNFKHRVQHEPVPEITPNPSDFYRGTYVETLEPQALKDTQLLILRYDDDTKQDDAYLYLGFQRRVRRLPTGQRTDSFLGTDLMIEDFEGYNGRVSDMEWEYKGTENLLMPFYKHTEVELTDEFDDPDGYQFVDFGGKGGCFPQINWQLRTVHIVEARPVDDSSPVSKRIFHMDAQTFTIPRTLIFDRSGKLWKSWTIGQAHPDHHLPVNKGTGVSLDDSFSMVDLQAKHCTTGQFKGQVVPELSPANMFQVQYLRTSR